MNLAAHHEGGGETALLGRARMVASITARVSEGQTVVIRGARGIGRTTVLEAVAAALPRPIAVRLSSHGSEGQGVRTLAARFSRSALEALPAPMREMLQDPDRVPQGAHRVDRLADALTELITLEAGRSPFAVVIDDVQNLDDLSLAAMRTAAARVTGPGTLGVLVGVGPLDLDEGGGLPDADSSRDLPVLTLDVPPLTGADTVEMLTAAGHPMDTALWAHRESGGNPGLAHEIAAAAESAPNGDSQQEVRSVARSRLHGVAPAVLRTLQHVAAMHQPTPRALVRLEGESASESIRVAKALGLLVTEDTYLRLTPGALGDVLTESLDSDELIGMHRALAEHAESEELARLHLAHAGDQDITPELLAESAQTCAARGEHDLAAQLYLLAAGGGTQERDEWLTRSLENAVIGKEFRVLHRAARATGELTDHGLLVRTRLALSELTETPADEVLVAALREAREDPALQAQVLLQRARLVLGDDDVRTARDLAHSAIVLAEKMGRTDIQVEALTVAAVVAQIGGEGDPRALIRRAVQLEGRPRPGQVHISPRYIAARFALEADDLTTAREEFVDMLATVGADAGLDTVHVLRGLVEIAARQGRGREALELAARATRAASHFDTPVATTWFVESIAENVGGSFERARTISARGVQLARAQDDERYLRRHLAVLGLAELHLDEIEDAVACFRELRRMEAARGIRDVVSLRWHADGVTALALSGALEEAVGLLEQLREVIEDGRGAPGVEAAADRAEAEIEAARGNLDRARGLADRSAASAHEHRLPVEEARSLVTLAQVERRARRTGRSLEVAARAREVLRPLHADPWTGWVRERFPGGAALHALETETEGEDPLAELTVTEQQVSSLVAEGASNREISQRLHLSVKTVEGTLTRVYRKLDVRSRTQLAAIVLGHGR